MCNKWEPHPVQIVVENYVRKELESFIIAFSQEFQE